MLPANLNFSQFNRAAQQAAEKLNAKGTGW
jgi:hypothetical protein